MALYEHRQMSEAEHEATMRYWRARANCANARNPSRLRLAWWRLCSWFREVVR